MNLTSTKKQKHLSPIVLLHGQPNTGKSVLTATCVVNKKPPLVLLFERGGTESLSEENLVRIFGAGRSDICYDAPVLECFDMGDAGNLEAALTANEKEFIEGGDEIPKGGIGSIVVDSISAMAKDVLEEAKQSGLTHGMQVYGFLSETVLGTIDAINRFGQKHGIPVIHQAQSMWSENPGGEGQVLYPVFEGKKILQTAPHDASEVWATFCAGEDEAGDPSYGLQLLRGDNIFAKSRWGAVRSVKGDDCHLGRLLEMKMGLRPVPEHLKIPSKTKPTTKPTTTAPKNPINKPPVKPATAK